MPGVRNLKSGPARSHGPSQDGMKRAGMQALLNIPDRYTETADLCCRAVLKQQMDEIVAFPTFPFLANIAQIQINFAE
jgi:hypothetical protein